MSDSIATDKSHALRVAAEIVSDHGTPKDYGEAVSLVSYAYARGCRDAAVKALELWAEAFSGDTDPRDST